MWVRSRSCGSARSAFDRACSLASLRDTVGISDVAPRLKVVEQVERIAGEIRALDEERRRLIRPVCCGADGGRRIHNREPRPEQGPRAASRQKVELVGAMRSPLHEDFVDASIRHFWLAQKRASRRARTSMRKRQFVVGHVERVIYNRYRSRSQARSRCNRYRAKPSCHFGSRARLTKWRCAQAGKNTAGRWAVESSAGACSTQQPRPNIQLGSPLLAVQRTCHQPAPIGRSWTQFGHRARSVVPNLLWGGRAGRSPC